MFNVAYSNQVFFFFFEKIKNLSNTGKTVLQIFFEKMFIEYWFYATFHLIDRVGGIYKEKCVEDKKKTQDDVIFAFLSD